MTVDPQLAGTSGGVESAAPIGDRKLRILCLHGYLQNSEIFRSRIGSMRKALKSRAEFFFVDAPYPAEPLNEQDVTETGGDSGAQGRSWWQWSDVEPGTRPSRAAHYRGWHASRAAIAAALQEHAPIDGLLGFSQGATATALFLAGASPDEVGDAAQQQQQDGESAAALPGPDTLRFAVLVAGFMPPDDRYAAALRDGHPCMPTLHVTGAADALVPEERTAALWSCFAPGSVHVYRHPGAHMVPTCSGEFKQALVSLLDDVKGGRLHQRRPEEQAAVQQQHKTGAARATSERAAVAAVDALTVS